MAKETTKKKATAEGVIGYSMKLKQKVVIQDAVIERTSRGGYIAKGGDGQGGKISAIMSEASANEAIKKGWATKKF